MWAEVAVVGVKLAFVLAVMLTSAIASMFISNPSTTVLMIGAVLPLVRQLGRDEPFAKALMVAIPLSASVGGMGTIIGSAPNAIAAGVAAAQANSKRTTVSAPRDTLAFMKNALATRSSNWTSI